MKRLRYGIVGCGAVVTLHHLPAFKRVPSAEVTALVDRDAAWGAECARKFGVAESFDDYAALVGRVDAVLLATPNTTHAEIGCRLLEAGIHVLCEKPIATTTDDLERMLASAAKGKSRLMAAHSTRFNANITTMKQFVAEGRLGPLERMTGSIGMTYAAAERRTDFRRDRALSGGGSLIDLGIHLLDVMVWLAGERPTSVDYAHACAPGWDVETDADVAMHFPTAGTAELSASFTHGTTPILTVRGRDGWMSASLYVPSQLAFFSPRARICRKAGVQYLVLDGRPPYERQIEHFTDAILSGTDFLVRDEEVRTDVAVIDHCYGTRRWPSDTAAPRERARSAG